MSRRALAEQEHQRRVERRRRRRRSGVVLAASLLALSAALLFAADHLFRPGAYPIEQVRMEGEFRRLDPEQLRERVVAALGDNFFALDLTRIEDAVESMHWVHHARVRRYWPRGLSVKVTEQRLVAHWNGQRWLNHVGEVVELPADVKVDALPQLTGPEGSGPLVLRRYRQWAPLLREAGLELGSLRLNGRYAWILELLPAGVSGDASFSVWLGRDEIEQRIQRFLRFYPRQLQADAGRVRKVDVRYPNGLAVQWAPVSDDAA
jgi:cell division protein FtsQ